MMLFQKRNLQNKVMNQKGYERPMPLPKTYGKVILGLLNCPNSQCSASEKRYWWPAPLYASGFF